MRNSVRETQVKGGLVGRADLVGSALFAVAAWTAGCGILDLDGGRYTYILRVLEGQPFSISLDFEKDS